MTEKILTKEIVELKDLDKLGVITADMLNGYTEIGDCAFGDCLRITSITIPNSVTSIGDCAFANCSRLTSVIIPNSVTFIDRFAFYDCKNLISITIPNSVKEIGYSAFFGCTSLTSVTIPNNVECIGNNAFVNCGFKVEKRYDEQGCLIAYKGFNADMSCRDFQYKEGNTYELDGEIELCRWGFHACINPINCFDYYYGKIGEYVVFHKVYLEGVSDEMCYDSKVVARKITIGREITLSEMADIASGRK